MIVTKRLTIQWCRAKKDAYEQHVAWLNDPENVRYSEQRHLRHTIETQDLYAAEHEDFREVFYGNQLVGTISADLDMGNSVANVGILIGKKYWGDGIGSEAWKGFCDHLLNTGVRKIEAGMMSINRGMIKICQKYEMFEEGRLAQHFLLDDLLVDQVNYGKFR